MAVWRHWDMITAGLLVIAAVAGIGVSPAEARSPEDVSIGAAALSHDTVEHPAQGASGGGMSMETRSRPRDTTRFFESPTGALLRSVVIPGWGQWSNGKKQKAVIWASMEGYFLTKALIWRSRASRAGTDTFADARDRRNNFYWLTGMTIFVSMFDAYADRYLLTLERTRDKGDGFWGKPPGCPSRNELWQLTVGLRF
jgi:hypothetical protein